MDRHYIQEGLKNLPNTFEKGKPFDRCTFCDCVFAPDEMYYVEKAFRNHSQFNRLDIILEYALCETCMQQIRASLSDVSKIKMNQFLESYVNPAFVSQGRCCITGAYIQDQVEFQAMAICANGDIQQDNFPMILGEKAVEQIQELLSAQTKEELDKFLDSVNGVPPNLKALLKSGDYVIV